MPLHVPRLVGTGVGVGVTIVVSTSGSIVAISLVSFTDNKEANFFVNSLIANNYVLMLLLRLPLFLLFETF